LNPIRTFGLGVDRDVTWYQAQPGEVLNLGAGNKHFDLAIPLDIERGWRAGESIPYEDETFSLVCAFNFWEHLNKDEILATLREVERVLIVDGLVNSVTPHWASEAAYQDLDHKSFWSESTWRNLFNNPYYEGSMPRDWRLKEIQSLIMGIVQRNLFVVSQLVKE
jgi:predicted SAM-dependent methyltransferase